VGSLSSGERGKKGNGKDAVCSSSEGSLSCSISPDPNLAEGHCFDPIWRER